MNILIFARNSLNVRYVWPIIVLNVKRFSLAELASVCGYLVENLNSRKNKKKLNNGYFQNIMKTV